MYARARRNSQEKFSRKIENGDTRPFHELQLTDDRWSAWTDPDPMIAAQRRNAICSEAAQFAWSRGMNGWLALMREGRVRAWVNIDNHMNAGAEEAPL
jgi:hypothetical protein